MTYRTSYVADARVALMLARRVFAAVCPLLSEMVFLIDLERTPSRRSRSRRLATGFPLGSRQHVTNERKYKGRK